MIITFSEKDILSSKIVTPSWYRVIIEEVEDKMSKDNTSTNSWLKGKILFNADDGSTEFANVPTPFLWMFNSKGAWAVVGLLKTMGFTVEAGKRADLSALVGKQVDAFIGNELYNGAMQNKMTGMYREPRADVSAKVTD